MVLYATSNTLKQPLHRHSPMLSWIEPDPSAMI